LEWGFSPFMVGLTLVSLGTDLPEIVNSIFSSGLGHGDINVGDSLGSVLTQMSLVSGLLPFFVGKFKVKRRDILIIGAYEILALILAVSIAEKGYITRVNALFLVAVWPVLMLLTRSATAKNDAEAKYLTERSDERHRRHFVIAALGFTGVGIGSFAVIESVIAISETLHISEYLISFFVVAIGTSLPELVVDLTAIRNRHYKLAMGDLIGSCIVDASFAIGIGPLIFPVSVSGQLVTITGLYAIFGSIVVISTLAIRKIVDKKTGALFILVYALSYTLLSCCPLFT
jgi:cation:H+ antiporter